MKLITTDNDHYEMYLKFWSSSKFFSKTIYIFHSDPYYILFQIVPQFSSGKMQIDFQPNKLVQFS